MIESIFLASIINAFEKCPIKEDAEAMYGYFYQTAYVDTGTSVEDHPTAKARTPSKNEAIIARACLLKSASLNNCSSLYSLNFFYKTGYMEEDFNFAKNQDLANEYKEKYNKYCAEKNA
jgi:hypothetical protein